jgi:DnaK suppressor protein
MTSADDHIAGGHSAGGHSADDRSAGGDALERTLQVDRDRTAARIADLDAQFASIVDSAELDLPDDEHDPEGSTIGFEQAQVRALMGQARIHLDELDRAMARVRAGTYGRCEECGEPIGEERLEALPDASTCIRCAEHGRRRR